MKFSRLAGLALLGMMPPYPYSVKDVRFPSRHHGLVLAGTLTVPKIGGRLPAVVLVSGSGRNNRDEKIFRHKPFAVLADYLTRQGFIVLRYDKRGIGESGGAYEGATIYDFADDAQGAVNYLKSIKNVDQQRIGMIGHSEGGEIAPMIAVRDHDVSYIVLLAGPALPGTQVLLRQYVLVSEGEGMSDADIQKEMLFQAPADEILAKSKPGDDTRNKLIALYHHTYSDDDSVPLLKAQLSRLNKPWVHTFLNYDPRPDLEKLTIPVLVLNGSEDRQVDPNQNLPVMRTELAKSGSKSVTVIEMPGLNHFFQDSRTGAISEYRVIPEAISGSALHEIGDWLIKTTKSE